eukprot:TRINITY_DN3671_c0_g1_i4.p2 TRINITY_DN3671_c0_g1~~TRINITY_DN3671_c0_g1_i4.p2  ORF type:complete len:205 (-),score=-6.42 TRINITY_DN3671_c0_g1_i4:342-956(-)
MGNHLPYVTFWHCILLQKKNVKINVGMCFMILKLDKVNNICQPTKQVKFLTRFKQINKEDWKLSQIVVQKNAVLIIRGFNYYQEKLNELKKKFMKLKQILVLQLTIKIYSVKQFRGQFQYVKFLFCDVLLILIFRHEFSCKQSRYFLCVYYDEVKYQILFFLQILFYKFSFGNNLVGVQTVRMKLVELFFCIFKNYNVYQEYID